MRWARITLQTNDNSISFGDDKGPYCWRVQSFKWHCLLLLLFLATTITTTAIVKGILHCAAYPLVLCCSFFMCVSASHKPICYMHQLGRLQTRASMTMTMTMTRTRLYANDRMPTRDFCAAGLNVPRRPNISPFPQSAGKQAANDELPRLT